MSLIHHEETSIPGFGASPEAKQAAVAVAEAFLEDTEPTVDLVEAAPVVVPSAPAAPPTDTDEPEQTTAEPAFDWSFEPQLTPELEDLLADDPPDFESEARAEIAAELQTAEDAGAYYDGDPDAAAKVRALEKRNAFLEQRLVETNRGKWLQENLKAYPLVKQFARDELEAITATSRRGFAREAAKVNERVAKIARPLMEAAQKQVSQGRETLVQTERDRVRDAWGAPATDDVGTGGAAKAERIRQARASEDLGKVFREMILPD